MITRILVIRCLAAGVPPAGGGDDDDADGETGDDDAADGLDEGVDGGVDGGVDRSAGAGWPPPPPLVPTAPGDGAEPQPAASRQHARPPPISARRLVKLAS
jgi:hypothetical protein